MQFQPKIIIGSVCGFIASAIGLIAIFFPSFFNLEQESIQSSIINLDNIQSYKDLYSFLKKNQEKYIDLSILYSENDRFYFPETTYLTQKIFIDSLEKRAIKPLLLTKSKDGRFGLSNVSDNVLIFSDFKFSSKQNHYSRQHGSISIWIEDNDETKQNSFIIMIPEESNGNTLYQWSTEENIQRMKLSGLFYVNKFIKESSYSEPIFRFMPLKWYKTVCFNKDCPEITIIELIPINKKDLLKNKY